MLFFAQRLERLSISGVTPLRRSRIFLSLVLLASGAGAQSKGNAPDPLAAIEIKATPEIEATLRIQNREITKLRATVGGFVPEQRAKNIVARVDQILNRFVSVPRVSRRDIPHGAAFYLDDHFIFGLTLQDIDLSTGETMSDAADSAERQLNLAIQESFEARNLPRLLKNLLWAALATAGFLAFLFVMQWIRHRLSRVLERKRLVQALFTRVVRSAFRATLGLAILIIELGIANLWITFVLRLFPYTRPWGESLSRKLLSMLLTIGSAISKALPDLLVVALIALICYGVTRLTNKFFAAIKSGDISFSGIHPEVVPPTRRIVVAVIWTFALIIAYPYLPGSKTDAFKGVSVFLGLLVTLGSSGIFGQAMSGILLMYSCAFRTGDYIRIGGIEGVVVELGTLSTKIRTIKNEVVSIPNSVVVSKEAKNFSRLQGADGVILHTSVTIGYTSPWRQVEALLIIAAGRTLGVKQDPAPFVLQCALGDYAVKYQINAYLERPEERIPTLALLHRNIQDIFNEHAVQIMTPHYRSDPAEPQVVAKDRWFEPPARYTDSAIDEVTNKSPSALR